MKAKVFPDYFLQPFRYIAGGKSLFFGFIILLTMSVLSYWNNIYFDGVIDIHFGASNHRDSFFVHLYCVFVPWLIVTLVFYLTALILTGKSVRLVDMAGTLALAKAPAILAVLLSLIPAVHSVPDIDPFDMQEIMLFFRENIFGLLTSAIFSILITIWSVLWMYNAYSVSGNLKGVKGVISFIIAFLISEILSKIALILLNTNYIS